MAEVDGIAFAEMWIADEACEDGFLWPLNANQTHGFCASYHRLDHYTADHCV
jgi:hypothetical protein